MSYMYFREWTIILILFELLCVYQMFFSDISRFTIACSYFTNMILMVFIWLYGWRVYKKFKVRMESKIPDVKYHDEKIKKALENCENEDEKLFIISKLWLNGIITNEEYLTKYAYWKCWVCKKTRLDEFISVKVHDVSLEHGFEKEGCSLINVKYCNDEKECTEKAINKLNWINI